MRFFLLFIFIFMPVIADAYVAERNDASRSAEITYITEPEQKHAYYGVLQGEPHTYEVSVERDTDISITLFVPDISSQQNNINGILVKKTGRRVEEVARLTADNATWEPVTVSATGDVDRRGPYYAGTLSAGEYIFEVNTPDNFGKYIVELGGEEEREQSYGETLRMLIDLKRFHETTPLFILEAPSVYIPLGVLAFIGIGVYLYRRKRMQQAMV